MDEINETTEPSFKSPRLRGTYGGLDYTIVAEKDNVHMGLKLMRETSYDKFPRCAVTIRLRTVFMRDAAGKEIRPFESSTAAKRQLLGAFPGLKYETCSDTPYGYRARTHVTFATGCPESQAGNAAEAFKEDRFYSKLYSFLETFVQEPAAFTLSYDEFEEALAEQIEEVYPVLPVSESEEEIDFSNVLEAKITNLAGEDGEAESEPFEDQEYDSGLSDEGEDIDF